MASGTTVPGAHDTTGRALLPVPREGRAKAATSTGPSARTPRPDHLLLLRPLKPGSESSPRPSSTNRPKSWSPLPGGTAQGCERHRASVLGDLRAGQAWKDGADHNVHRPPDKGGARGRALLTPLHVFQDTPARGTADWP